MPARIFFARMATAVAQESGQGIDCAQGEVSSENITGNVCFGHSGLQVRASIDSWIIVAPSGLPLNIDTADL
jgi:hypothetical protein